MRLSDLKWLWKISALVCEQDLVSCRNLYFWKIRIFKRRVNFLVKGARLIVPLQKFMHPTEGSPLQRAMEQRPVLVGVVIWPYICASWSAKICLQRIDEHFRVIEMMGTILDFPFEKALILLDLPDVHTNLRMALDQPKWLMREGLFAINLFWEDVRIYSLAFSFGFEEGKVVSFIGALQGVGSEGILDVYRILTKALHGMRPRDFLIESFRTFCRCVGVSKIYAVNDEHHLKYSRYFRNKKSTTFFQNYNDIWIERSGVKSNAEFFDLSLESPMKILDDVPAKKRTMYRRRYQLLRSLEERMQISLKEHKLQSITRGKLLA